MVDQWLPERLRRAAVVTRGEAAILRVARAALTALFNALKAAVTSDGQLNTGILDNILPNWRTSLEDAVLPAVEDVFGKAFREFLDTAIYSPDQYAEKHLAEVRNQLVRTTDKLFDDIRATLEEGRRAGEDIPKLTERVAALVGPSEAYRAERIARCLPAEATVDSAVVRAVTRRWYEGSMAVVVTETGRELTATPNHPMLTSRGWVAAGELREGDYLVRDARQQDAGTAGNQDVANPPATIAEVFEAAAAVGICERRSGTQPDFHGDGMQGEVDIARADRELRYGNFVPLYQEVMQDVFAPTHQALASYCGFCSRLLSVDQQACLCRTPGGQPSLLQDTSNQPSGDAQIISDVGGWSTAGELADDPLGVDAIAPVLGAAPRVVELGSVGQAAGNASAPHPIQDSAAVDADGEGDGVAALPVDVALDCVISVEIRPFSGHVYNLHTPYGYFTTNTYFTGNTETLRAYNSGHLSATMVLADALDVPHHEVVKRWLTTIDGRQRLSHEIADGQRQYLDQPFKVGGHNGMYPGDPDLPAEESIQCRCTALFYLPGDIGYNGGSLTASTFDTTVIVAIPEDADGINQVGDESKHSTLLFLGPSADIDLEEVLSEVGFIAQGNSLFQATVSGRGELGDDNAKVVFVESQPLVDIREQLLSGGEISRAYLSVDQYPNWIPHVTLTYQDMPDTSGLDAVMFDRLAIWHGDDHYTYELGGGMSIAAEDIPMAMAPASRRWYGILAPEDVMSGDNRIFLGGSLRQRPLPMPLAWQVANWQGHDGSQVVANIEGARRHNGVIRGWGTFAEGDEASWQIESQIGQDMGWGISVDVDDFEADLQNMDGGIPTDEDMMEGRVRLAVTSGRISGATIVAIPAFAEATIQLGAPPPEWLTEGEPLSERDPAPVVEADPYTTLIAAGRPVVHAAAFSNPNLTDLTPLTIHEDGRIFGHLAGWNVCHTSFGNACVTAPHSATGYSYFATGEVLFEDGRSIAVGQITMDTSHADTRMSARPATAHYDQTGTVVADVVMGEDAYGIYFTGMLRRHLEEEDVERLRAAALSGDWRRVGGNLELVAALAVNVPGYPIPRTKTGFQAQRQVALVASGVVRQSPSASVAVEVDTMRIAAGVMRDMQTLRQRDTRRERAAAMIALDKESRVRAATALLEQIEED